MPTRNIEDLSANLTSIATKLKKRSKISKLADRSPARWFIVQEYKQDPTGSDSDDAQKLRKAPSFRFRNANFQNGYFSVNPYKNKI